MLEIIRHAEIIETTTYSLAFCFADADAFSGFAFDCDAAGVVNVDALNPAARANYEACLTGAVDGRALRRPTVETDTHTYREPKIGRCVCGAEVYLDRFTNTCDRCERDYNSAGQELAPRSQWGEETGETLSDILSVDSGADRDDW